MKAIFTTAIFSIFLSLGTYAQSNLMYYWHFNNFTTVGTAGDPSLIAPIPADTNFVTGTTAEIRYRALPGVSAAYQSFWDFLAPGDTTNQRFGAIDGNCLRTRNWDSMQLQFKIPSTGLKNIVFSYAVERSGSGPTADTFAYSIDGGVTWKTSGLSLQYFDAVSALVPPFNKVVVSINDVTANNNPNLFFRIVFGPITAPLKGNQRFDNVVIEGTPITLPLKLAYFNAENIENAVKLNWNYTNAISVSNIVLEHSNNGKDFLALSTFKIGNSSNASQSFVDAAPFKNANYYRLKIVDVNGSITHSDIKTVMFNKKYSVQIAPNPATTILNINGNFTNEKTTATIINSQGKQVVVKDITGSLSKASLNIANLQSGIYTLILNSATETSHYQFIKQ